MTPIIINLIYIYNFYIFFILYKINKIKKNAKLLFENTAYVFVYVYIINTVYM